MTKPTRTLLAVPVAAMLIFWGVAYLYGSLVGEPFGMQDWKLGISAGLSYCFLLFARLLRERRKSM